MKGSWRMAIAIFRNRRISFVIFLPVLFLGIVLSSAPVISVANVGIIVNFIFDNAYPIDTYLMLNLSYEGIHSYKFEDKSGDLQLKVNVIGNYGAISHTVSQVYERVRGKIYRLGILHSSGQSFLLILMNNTSGIWEYKGGERIAMVLDLVISGPKIAETLLGKENVTDPILIFPDNMVEGILLKKGGVLWTEAEKPPNEVLRYFSGANLNFGKQSLKIDNIYYPGCGKLLPLSYSQLYDIVEGISMISRPELKVLYGTNEIHCDILNYALLILPKGLFSKFLNLGLSKVSLEGEGVVGSGHYVPYNSALFMFGVNPAPFIREIYSSGTFKEKLNESIYMEEKIFNKSLGEIPVINYTSLFQVIPPLGKKVVIYFPQVKDQAKSYLVTSYYNDVERGNYVVTASFIFTFPLLFLVSLVILTTILENGVERSKEWLRIARRRGVKFSTVSSAFYLFSTIMAILGGFSGIIFSSIILPRIISAMMHIPITQDPEYYLKNYLMYVFSIPTTVLVGMFSVRSVSKRFLNMELVGKFKEKQRTLRVSRATTVISLISIYAVLIWYFRVTPEKISAYSDPILTAIYITSAIISFPFLLISPLLIPRFLSLLSFVALEKMTSSLRRFSEKIAGDLGVLGFESFQQNIERLKTLGYALTLSLSTTLGMILVKSALPKVLDVLSATYFSEVGIIFYIFRSISMLLVMVSIFAFCIGTVGTYGCIVELLDEIRPQLVVARARGSSWKKLLRMSYGALFPYLLYSSFLSVLIGFTLLISVDGILSLLGAGIINIPHLVPSFDAFYLMYFTYLGIVFMAPYLVSKSFLTRPISHELRRLWS